MWPFRFLSLSCSKSGSQKSWTTLFTTPFTLRITLRRELTLFTTPFSTLHQERLPKYRTFIQGSMNLHYYCESRLAKKQELKYSVGLASPFSSTKKWHITNHHMHHWLSFKWVHLVYKLLKGPILTKYETRSFIDSAYPGPPDETQKRNHLEVGWPYIQQSYVIYWLILVFTIHACIMVYTYHLIIYIYITMMWT